MNTIIDGLLKEFGGNLEAAKHTTQNVPAHESVLRSNFASTYEVPSPQPPVSFHPARVGELHLPSLHLLIPLH